MNKKVLIGLGVLAVAGIGLYMWNKNKKVEKSDEKSSDEGKSSEKKSNARGFTKPQSSISPDQVNCPEGCEKIWVNDSKVPANSHWACDCGSKGIKAASFS